MPQRARAQQGGARGRARPTTHPPTTTATTTTTTTTTLRPGPLAPLPAAAMPPTRRRAAAAAGDGGAPAPAGPCLSLAIRSGPCEGTARVVAPKLAPVSVGRTRANQFQIKDQEVSSKHAELTFRDGKWRVRDLGSSNGTFINGKEVPPPKSDSDPHGPERVLKTGDRIEFGGETLAEVRYVDMSGEDAAKPAKPAAPKTAAKGRATAAKSKRGARTASAAVAEAAAAPAEEAPAPTEAASMDAGSDAAQQQGQSEKKEAQGKERAERVSAKKQKTGPAKTKGKGTPVLAEVDVNASMSVEEYLAGEIDALVDGIKRRADELCDAIRKEAAPIRAECEAFLAQ